ncbi:MAG: hypothetical protein HKN19_06510 [Halioglobus sp.]|nr:hypothetical protein [Halioglobus sp.]
MASKLLKASIPAAILRWASGLRFPALFIVTVLLFGVDLVVPDVVPFVDEILLGLGALLFASWRKRSRSDEDDRPAPE